MQCLTQAQIQAVVDNEAGADLRGHAASCTWCAERVRDRAALTDALVASVTVPAAIPPALARRVSEALAEGASHGATRLRAGGSERPSWRAAWSAAAVAAATVVAILFVAPLLKAPSTVSAAEILAKSAGRLAEAVTSGTEALEYELVLDGVPRELMPEHADGVYRVRQVIDHDTKGRYFVATYGSDGRQLSAIAQDPARGTRVMNVRLDNQPYRFEFTVPANVPFSPPQMERLHMEASVAMMQASGNQHLQVVEGPAGPQYRIEVPQVSGAAPNAVWDLTEARVLIDAGDYHIVEFAVKGSFLKNPYSVSYRLISRTVAPRGSAKDSDFELPLEAGAIEIQGEGSAIPARDALVLSLRELAKAKGAR